MIFFIILLAFTFALSQPLVGEADNLTYERDKVIYTGNVKITRGNAIITADRVIIYLEENRKAKLAEAEGGVKYAEEKRKASANRMIYDFQRDIITLQGKAKVEEGPNFVEADEIVYYRKEDRAIATSKGSRVRTFYLEEKNEKVGPDKKAK
ncbi:MAG: lipopolysaccharide transport periplasmic protein LptA [Acidobacteria bacterium]|jgi:lipopolysaccharide export system protein LptA|nr:MAG: lipopolysaccharide transport periplasmic protein LptA [Acidobacteriota bacterium]